MRAVRVLSVKFGVDAAEDASKRPLEASKRRVGGWSVHAVLRAGVGRQEAVERVQVHLAGQERGLAHRRSLPPPPRPGPAPRRGRLPVKARITRPGPARARGEISHKPSRHPLNVNELLISRGIPGHWTAVSLVLNQRHSDPMCRAYSWEISSHALVRHHRSRSRNHTFRHLNNSSSIPDKESKHNDQCYSQRQYTKHRMLATHE